MCCVCVCVCVCVCGCVCVRVPYLSCCRDIPVDMKYVAEPQMHSMPSVTVHPSGESPLTHAHTHTHTHTHARTHTHCTCVGKWLGCQSMDNKITVFGVHNNFRLNRKKTFKGHMVSGYACQLDFSPDGT